MIGLLIFPVLVCGYIYLTESPAERIRISLYHGWSLYIRAAQFGILIVAVVALLFGYVLPWLGVLIGRLTGITLLPHTHLFMLLAQLMASGLYSATPPPPATMASLQIASLSLCSIAFTWSIAWSCQRFTWLGATRLQQARRHHVVKLLRDQAPIEHHLVTIMTQAKIDLAHNAAILEARTGLSDNLRKGTIDRHDRMSRSSLLETLKQLKYRKITYALVTLENDKVYIGLPTIVPEPDEESVVSNAIRLIPLRSGYRHEQNKQVNLTTQYDFDLAAPRAEFEVSLQRDKIISVSGFTFNLRHPSSASVRPASTGPRADANTSPPSVVRRLLQCLRGAGP